LEGSNRVQATTGKHNGKPFTTIGAYGSFMKINVIASEIYINIYTDL